jgi:hypothetical protein
LTCAFHWWLLFIKFSSLCLWFRCLVPIHQWFESLESITLSCRKTCACLKMCMPNAPPTIYGFFCISIKAAGSRVSYILTTSLREQLLPLLPLFLSWSYGFFPAYCVHTWPETLYGCEFHVALPSCSITIYFVASDWSAKFSQVFVGVSLTCLYYSDRWCCNGACVLILFRDCSWVRFGHRYTTMFWHCISKWNTSGYRSGPTPRFSSCWLDICLYSLCSSSSTVSSPRLKSFWMWHIHVLVQTSLNLQTGVCRTIWYTIGCKSYI